MMIRQLLFVGLLSFGAGVLAQGAAPARPAPAAPDPTERPAVSMSPDAKPAAVSPASPGAPRTAGKPEGRDTAGSTIVGERESPIGLYITPWRNAYAEQDIDRPARLLQVDLSPVDREVFSRQVEYYDALTQASLAKKAPPAAVPTTAPASAAPP